MEYTGLISSKDKKLVRQLSTYVRGHANATLFYWSCEDINNLEMDEAQNSHERAKKLEKLLQTVGYEVGICVRHIIDWNGKALFLNNFHP